jgi:hypothetical protein
MPCYQCGMLSSNNSNSEYMRCQSWGTILSLSSWSQLSLLPCHRTAFWTAPFPQSWLLHFNFLYPNYSYVRHCGRRTSLKDHFKSQFSGSVFFFQLNIRTMLWIRSRDRHLNIHFCLLHCTLRLYELNSVFLVFMHHVMLPVMTWTVNSTNLNPSFALHAACSDFFTL